MKYLLDADALLALGIDHHEAHLRVSKWMETLRRGKGAELATCAITELAFVRIGAAAGYCVDVDAARRLISALHSRATSNFELLPDGLGVEAPPAWASTPSRTTDGHLLALAKYHGAELATLDRGIPGAFLIP